MAEHIKFRLTAAKVGVSAALVALIGGVVDRIRSTPEFRFTPTSAPGQFLKLGGIPADVKHALIKLEDKWIKLDTALTDVVQKLRTEYVKVDKANTEFLKIQKADAEFLKIQKADAEFLKINKADASFLKIKKATAEFLKLEQANAEFLKIRAAQNEFLQGRGGVVSATAPVLADGSVSQLLKSPDGSVTVSVKTDPLKGGIIVVCHNNTGELLPAVQITDGTTGPADLSPNSDRDFSLGSERTPHHFQLQTWGDGTSNAAQTLVLSTELSPSNSAQSMVVGQMLIGLL